MDNKNMVYALVVIVIVVIAAAGVYIATSGGGNGNGSDGGDDSDETDTPSVTETKRWNIVILDPDGDPDNYQTHYVKVGDRLEEPSINAKEDMTFMGWTVKETGYTWDFGDVVTDDMVLEGNWSELFSVEIDGYTVTVTISDEWADNTTLINWGDTTAESLNAGDNTAVHDYIMSNVTIEVTSIDGDEMWKSTHRLNLDGHYNPVRTHTVWFDTVEGSYLGPQTVNHGEKVLKPGTPIREGYIFDGWTLNGSEYDFDSPVYNEITLRASWVADPDYNGRIVPDARASITETFDGWILDASNSKDAMHYVWYDGKEVIGFGETIELSADDYPGYHTIKLVVYSNTNATDTWSDIIRG